MIDTQTILARWAREAAGPYGGQAVTRLNVQLPVTLKEALDALAREEGVTTPEMARRMLAEKTREAEKAILGRRARETYPETIEIRRHIGEVWRDVREEALDEWARRSRGRRRARKAR